jgi:hypothetical protein
MLKNTGICLICILEDLSDAIFFISGAMFMWCLLIRPDLVLWYLGGGVALAVIFNLVTEWIYWRSE